MVPSGPCLTDHRPNHCPPVLGACISLSESSQRLAGLAKLLTQHTDSCSTKRRDVSQEHLRQRWAATANVYENDDRLSCEENESRSMQLMPAIKPVLAGRAVLTCHGRNRGRQWTRCFNSPHTLPVSYYEAGVRESYVWSNKTKPNQQANKNCSLAHFLGLFLKNCVF